MPAIRASIEASLIEAQWINNAYMLPLSALILAGGALGDRFGLARIFTIGIGLFIAASVASALAPTPETLIAARALKGIGAAMMVPGSLALIYRAYPPDERGRAIGQWAAASAMTTALGPVLGGLLITAAGPETWRWLFAINLPLGLIAVWLLRGAVNEDVGDPGRGVDWVGAGLATLGLGLGAWVLTGLTGEGGPEPAPWGTAAIGLLIAFVLWEARSAHPMMPLSLFASTRFSAANLATFCLYFALSAVLFFLPMTVISAWGVSEAAASLAFLPLTAAVALLSTAMGRLADRHGPGRLIGAGSALVAIAYAALAITAPLQAYWSIVIPLMCIMGFGMALVVAPLSAAVMGAVSEAQAGAASGVNNAVSRIAGLVAIAAMGAVAAAGYAAADGPASFGAPAEGTAHAVASTAAFQTVAWATAATSAIAAAIAFLGIRPNQTG